MPPKEITQLKDAIRATHGCESLHVESVPVKEVFESQTAWEGTVEVFDLVGHLQAKRAYAWTYRDGDQNKTITVLGIPPVDSPQSAVKVAVAARGVLISQQRKSRMRDKKKKTKKQIKIQDLKPSKDAKGGSRRINQAPP